MLLWTLVTPPTFHAVKWRHNINLQSRLSYWGPGWEHVFLGDSSLSLEGRDLTSWGHSFFLVKPNKEGFGGRISTREMSLRVWSILQMGLLFIKCHLITLNLSMGKWVRLLLSSFICLPINFMSAYYVPGMVKAAGDIAGNRSPLGAHILAGVNKQTSRPINQ